jgi:hypothetical protein
MFFLLLFSQKCLGLAFFPDVNSRNRSVSNLHTCTILLIFFSFRLWEKQFKWRVAILSGFKLKFKKCDNKENTKIFLRFYTTISTGSHSHNLQHCCFFFNIMYIVFEFVSRRFVEKYLNSQRQWMMKIECFSSLVFSTLFDPLILLI